MAKRTPEPWYHPPQEEICALCGRAVPPSERDLHHLVPKSQGGKQTAVLHRICHRQLHALFTEKELAQRYSTVDALLAHEAVHSFVEWVKTKPDSFYQRTRRARAR
ncbi:MULTISPECIES: HNH endonuclease [Caballeronia]|jgi:hypothetical protein|uniref:HNH endonuclease n=3 Tax=Caballeronia TaxID=1827195 RepID=A0ACB5QNU3_9BURK|nr:MULTISPECIES: HNH endonuclease signature motif containing protein [Caballeronia]KAK45514.1 restriction endonuclease [Caballeronia jiangsuensis]GJH12970.1 HNH endonuclease [Caballeronia novacaledonica]GJH16743.1 HNH endonuclease [Caballeronia novacaledonica]GJH24466.1 HNH endonuclease [Caballeronia novacaledonica]